MIIGNTLDLATIEKIVFEGEKIQIEEEVIYDLKSSFEFLKEFSRNRVIYGINTGFGPMAQYRVDDADLAKLQYKIN